LHQKKKKKKKPGRGREGRRDRTRRKFSVYRGSGLEREKDAMVKKKGEEKKRYHVVGKRRGDDFCPESETIEAVKKGKDSVRRVEKKKKKY